MAERYVRPPLTATEPDPLRGGPARMLRRLALALAVALAVAAVVAGGLALGHRLNGGDQPGVGAPAGRAAPADRAPDPTTPAH